MKKIKIQCHSVLRYGISKILVASTLILISVNAFAYMDDCVNAIKLENWKDGVKYCEPLARENREASILTGDAYAQLRQGIKAQKFLQLYISKFVPKDKNLQQVANGYTSLGNYYYFGEDGAKKDIKKGLEYITKGAQLGNSIAQEQLGTVYFNGDNAPVNYPLAYMWYTISANNGNQKAKNNYFAQHMTSYTQQSPYCVALGDQLLAQSYIEGTGGLSKNDNQARQYLIQAIELYKEAKKPSEDELKYCPKQKGLDLASAEKLLKSL